MRGAFTAGAHLGVGWGSALSSVGLALQLVVEVQQKGFDVLLGDVPHHGIGNLQVSQALGHFIREEVALAEEGGPYLDSRKRHIGGLAEREESVVVRVAHEAK